MFSVNLLCPQCHEVVRSSDDKIICLKGLGATPNKSSGASCLDADIACEFVKNLVEVRFLGQEIWIMEGGIFLNRL